MNSQKQLLVITITYYTHTSLDSIVNSQKQLLVITITYYTHTSYYIYIKKLFLLTEAVFFQDSNSTSDKRECVYRS